MFSDKTLDIVLEEGASLDYVLTIETEREVCVAHPLTGEDTNCHIQTEIPQLTGTFAGSIVSEFGESELASFVFAIDGDGSSGIVSMSLALGTIQTLADSVRSTPEIGKNPRMRKVGFYNVEYTDISGTDRIMEGKVSMSLGA